MCECARRSSGFAICASTETGAVMEDEAVYDQASSVDAEDGVVIVSGPDALRVRFTPEAAEETADRLTTGALKARGQRYFSDPDRFP